MWRWTRAASAAYLAALWGSLLVILATVGYTPILDATRPGDALTALAIVVAGASFLGRGTAGISGAMAGAGSAYAFAIITTLRAAERNWAFVAPGPASAWQVGVTEALVRSLVVLAAAALVAALGRELLDRGHGGELGRWRPRLLSRLAGPAIAVLIACAALAGTSMLIAVAAQTSIVLPAQVPTVTATGQGPLVTVSPAVRSPGEALIVVNSVWAETCAEHECSGGLELLGPLSDTDLASLRIGTFDDDLINRLPRPEYLWYGGVSLGEGRYAFVHTVYFPDPGDSPRLIGVGILEVSAGPTPAVVARTPGGAPRFVWVERILLTVHWAAISLVLFRRGRIARLAGTQRWLAAVGLATLATLILAGGMAFYVSLAGSPF